VKKERWQLCNVVSTDEVGRRLWQFRTKGDAFSLVKGYSAAAGEKLPAKVVGKTFQSFWKKKLNIALLPPGNVFMGVVELPSVDSSELHGMLEFQLEKLSPLPVTHIVWTYFELPNKTDGMTRIVLVITSRNEVEALLGKLEKAGFLADQLEFPLLDELLSLLDKPDGLWLLPLRTEKGFHALAVWIAGGELHNVTMFHLPEIGWEESLTTQLSQTVWAGELDGWLPGIPVCHLVADAELAVVFEPVLREFSQQTVEVMPPLDEATLTNLTANRATKIGSPARLLPPEISKRYHQVFVDGIWMRSLGVVLLAYILGVLLYFIGIEWAKYQHTETEDYLNSIALAYTNTVHASQRVQILQNQMNLKYAALDSFRAVSEHLPEGVILNNFSFQSGNKIAVYGTAPQADSGKVAEFVDQLRSAESDGRKLFASVRAPNIMSQPGTQLNRWDFVCELANPEEK